jgi:tRNA(Ile)-lysidine synthase
VDPVESLLAQCHFPAAGHEADLAVSGGPDSLGLLLLALARGLVVRVHHVDHHARPTSTEDARALAALCDRLGVSLVVHDAFVAPGANFESRARAARRAALPAGALTGHTMDDLAETMLINLMRGAGRDGLTPMAGDPTKPLRDVRRAALHDLVGRSGHVALVDETNSSRAFVRNRVRHEVLPLLNDVARRDVVPVLARQAALMDEERRWLDALSRIDAPTLEAADCRELRTWPTARLRRWLRDCLRDEDHGDGAHPPSADEVERAMSVVTGEVVATQLSGGRRLARRAQRLRLE